MMSDLAVFVYTCNKYNFVWEGFYYYFKKHWDVTCNIPIYFVSETVPFEKPEFINILNGVNDWSTHILKGLDKIQEEHILFIQDDHWFRLQVDATLLEKLFTVYKYYNMDAFRICAPCRYYSLAKTDIVVHDQPISKFTANSEYLMSYQISIASKDFMRKGIKAGEDPWTSEWEGTKRYSKLNPNIYFYPLEWCINAACKGKLTDDGKQFIKTMREEQKCQ